VPIWTRKRNQQSAGVTLGGVNLGEHPWLVLGGGGLKGLAHLGACSTLREAGFNPAGILGTSIGALVGACVAGGRPIDELIREAHSLDRAEVARVLRRALWLKGVRSESVFRGDSLRSYLSSVLPQGGWEDLQIRFQANAVELGHGRTEWFGIGARTDVSLVDAVYASAALPVFYPPAALPGGIYVDGGTEDALPLHRAAELGATGIVAIDVGAGELADAPGLLRMGLLAVHERVFSIMSGRRRRAMVADWDGPPLLYVRPKLDGFGGFDFDHIQTFIRLGSEAAESALGIRGEGVGGGDLASPFGPPGVRGVPAP